MDVGIWNIGDGPIVNKSEEWFLIIDDSFELLVDESDLINELNNIELSENYITFIKDDFFTNEKIIKIFPIVKKELYNSKFKLGFSIDDFDFKLISDNERVRYEYLLGIYRLSNRNHSFNGVVVDKLSFNYFNTYLWLLSQRECLNLNFDQVVVPVMTTFEPKDSELLYWKKQFTTINTTKIIFNDNPEIDLKLSNIYNINNIEIHSLGRNLKKFHMIVAQLEKYGFDDLFIKIIDPDDLILPSEFERFQKECSSTKITNKDYSYIIHRGCKVDSKLKLNYSNIDVDYFLKKSKERKFSGTFGNYQILYNSKYINEYYIGGDAPLTLTYSDDVLLSWILVNMGKGKYINSHFYIQFHAKGLTRKIDFDIYVNDLKKIYTHLISNDVEIDKINLPKFYIKKYKIKLNILEKENLIFHKNIWDVNLTK